MDKQVAAILVTYNGEACIKDCLDSLLASSYPLSIIVVDNNSSDNTRSILNEDKYSAIEQILMSDNQGFGRANNIGISAALKQNKDFVYLVNQDATIDAKCISQLLNAHKKNPNFGILSPLHLFNDGLERSFKKWIGSNSQLISDLVVQQKMDDVYAVDFVNAAHWLIPKQVLEDVGGFDPLFFLYGEDDNYAERVKHLGYKIGICPKAKATHEQTKKRFKDSKYNVMRFKNSCLAYILNPKQSLRRNMLKLTSSTAQFMLHNLRKGKIKNAVQIKVLFLNHFFKWGTYKKQRAEYFSKPYLFLND